MDQDEEARMTVGTTAGLLVLAEAQRVGDDRIVLRLTQREGERIVQNSIPVSAGAAQSNDHLLDLVAERLVAGVRKALDSGA